MTQQLPPAIFGFKLYWTGDEMPGVTSGNAELKQAMFNDYATNTSASTLAPYVHLLDNGLSLPYFWAMVKTSRYLKYDLYNYWHLGEACKHLLASWIIAQQNPRKFIATRPLLWEVYPTMVHGWEVQAKINLLPDSQVYKFDMNAQPTNWYLRSWLAIGDTGNCLLVRDSVCIQVIFALAELFNKPIEMVLQEEGQQIF